MLITGLSLFGILLADPAADDMVQLDTLPEETSIDVVQEESTAEDRPGNVPDSSQLPPLATTLTQDEVVPAAAPTLKPALVPENETSRFSVDDLSHLDLGFDTNENEQQTDTPAEPVEVFVPLPPATLPPPPAQTSPVERLSLSGYEACGSLEIPTGIMAPLALFTAQNDPAIICLGEAVASASCTNSEIVLTSDSTPVGSVYVAKRTGDNACSVGVRLTPSMVTFCSIASIMNHTDGKDKTMRQWRSAFRDDPGQVFANLYIQNSDAFTNPNAMDDYDCVDYQL